MGEKGFLDKVYDLDGADAVQGFYDDWSSSYDDEVAENGYATPTRCANALIRLGMSTDISILDFGCGTGISGLAFNRDGFTDLHGVDLSAEMLRGAEAKGIYRSLRQIGPDEALPRGFDVIAAVGVIGAGAAPPEAFDLIMDALSPGARMVFSYNDHALEDPRFPAKLAEHLDRDATLLFEEYGPHLPKIDINSVVYVIEKNPE